MRIELMNRLSLCIASASLAITSVVAGPAWAQAEPLLELHSVGMYDWPVDRHDEKLVEAVKLLRERMGDLAGELDLEPVQAQMMEMGWDLLTGGSSIYFAPSDQGFDAAIVLSPANGSTEGMQQQLSGLAMMGGMEFVDQGDGSAQAMGPMGPMTLGHDAQRLWLSMGGADPHAMEVKRYGLPAGATPLVSGRIDVNGLLNMFAPGMAEEFEAQVTMMGMGPAGMFFGEDAVIVEFAAGADDEQMHFISRLIGAKRAMANAGTTPELFTGSDLRAIPADAVRVSAMQTNIGAALQSVETAMAMSGEDYLAEFNAEVGVDLMDDVLANIGDRVIYYQSETTGGGGLLSAVALIDLRDAGRLGRAHQKLVDKLNELAEDNIDGYARVQRRSFGGAEIFTMTAPGLPIPIEPSWAIHGERLVIALSPVSIEAALAQLSPRASGSVMDNPQFKAAVLSRMPREGAASVNYIDAPRMAAKGYGLTNMLTSAIANAARSPSEPGRVQGALMPQFTSFVRGVQPMGSLSVWDGDDLVTRYSGDRSILVQMAAGLGTVADVQGVMFPALAAGVMLPAIGKARQRANELKSSTQLRSIAQAMMIYGTNNNDQPPKSVQELIDLGYLEPEILVSPMGSAYDGGPDYAVRLTEDAVSSFDARYIMGIDRAAYVNGEWFVGVAFADAHVERMDRAQLDEMLAQPRNKGAAEDLQIEGF